MSLTTFWRKHVFTFAIAGCLLFVLLTALAMLLYPGGTYADPAAPGYAFLHNFFSDLGRLQAHNGRPNTLAAALFALALATAGLGLVLFFLAFPRCFAGSRLGQVLSILGSAVGGVSGLCFVGVALTPADVSRGLHVQFVLWAFRLFPVAALLYALAILREPGYPKRYALVFGVFGLLLVGYILLLELGPGIGTPQGVLIQVTGQKVIAYASILGIMVQAWGARALNRGERRA